MGSLTNLDGLSVMGKSENVLGKNLLALNHDVTLMSQEMSSDEFNLYINIGASWAALFAYQLFEF